MLYANWSSRVKAGSSEVEATIPGTVEASGSDNPIWAAAGRCRGGAGDRAVPGEAGGVSSLNHPMGKPTPATMERVRFLAILSSKAVVRPRL